MEKNTKSIIFYFGGRVLDLVLKVWKNNHTELCYISPEDHEAEKSQWGFI